MNAPCPRCGDTRPHLPSSCAAIKAAATRRAKRNGGQAAPRPRTPFTPPRPTPPPPPASNPWAAPPPPPTPPPPPAAPRSTWTAAPKPTVASARLAVVAALEDLFVLDCKATGITDDKRKAFETFKKVLTKALAPASSVEMRNENDTALRQAALQMVRLTF